MTYDALYEWAASWGLLILVVFHVSAVIYALWPSNKNKFKAAADQPLRDDETYMREIRS